MNKSELLKYSESLSDSDDVIVRKKAEETDYLNNFKKQAIDQQMPDILKSIHDQYDEDLFKITGQKRTGTGVHTYDFMKQIYSDLKSKADKGTELEGQIKTLQDQIKAGAHDQGLLNELEDVKKRYGKLQSDTKLQLAEKEKAFQDFRVGAEIDKAIAGFKIKDTIPDAVKTTYLETKRAELLKSAKIEDGKLVFIDSNGIVMKNITTMNPMTINEILKDTLLPIIDEGIINPGAGADPNKAASKTSAAYFPANGLKLDDLSEDVQAKTGYKRGTPEYQKAFNEGYKILAARK